MPPIDTESQFRFLISCIRNSSAGKVNFTEVANECDIVSKGAAAKRYERLMRAHGIQSSGAPGGTKKETGDSKDTKELKDAKEGRKGRGGTTASKKRKLAAVEEEAGDIDEPVKAEVKGEVKSEVKLEDAVNVKPERPNDDLAMPPPAGGLTNDSTAIDDDDDEILVVSVTEKHDTTPPSPYSGGHHHHHIHHPYPHHHHSYSLAAPTIPGIHSFDYATAANMGFPQHQQDHARLQSLPASSPSSTRTMTNSPTPTTTATMMDSSVAYPYGFGPGPWMFPSHDTAHGYLQ
ncbi:hypothetical protein F4810DRAFT_724968 [Camillea tinctor]|nr:hypothetical protein F4810DRAFT_724968 [Camillea tinctor]